MPPGLVECLPGVGDGPLPRPLGRPVSPGDQQSAHTSAHTEGNANDLQTPFPRPVMSTAAHTERRLQLKGVRLGCSSSSKQRRPKKNGAPDDRVSGPPRTPAPPPARSRRRRRAGVRRTAVVPAVNALSCRWADAEVQRACGQPSGSGTDPWKCFIRHSPRSWTSHILSRKSTVSISVPSSPSTWPAAATNRCWLSWCRTDH